MSVCLLIGLCLAGSRWITKPAGLPELNSDNYLL